MSEDKELVYTTDDGNWRCVYSHPYLHLHQRQNLDDLGPEHWEAKGTLDCALIANVGHVAILTELIAKANRVQGVEEQL